LSGTLFSNGKFAKTGGRSIAWPLNCGIVKFKNNSRNTAGEVDFIDAPYGKDA
jgi:hypothetical protein